MLAIRVNEFGDPSVLALEEVPDPVAGPDQTLIEVEAAEKLLSIVPNADMVKFSKDGSDATSGAVKIARARLFELMQEDPGLAEHFQLRLAARLQRIAIELKVIDEQLAVATEPVPATLRELAATG